MDRIKSLVAEVKDCIGSEENRRRVEVHRRLNRLEPVNAFNSWQFCSGVLGAVSLWARRVGKPIDISRIARAAGAVTPEFAAEVIEFQLLAKLEAFRNTPDDTPLSPVINTNCGLCWLFEDGPLGETHVLDVATGANAVQAMIHAETDLDKLEVPRYEFDRNLHEKRVAVYRDLVDGELPVIDDGLPARIGSPFGTAYNIRGGLELLMDMKVRPKFVHRLMGFIAEAIIAYNAEGLSALAELGLWRNASVTRDGKCVASGKSGDELCTAAYENSIYSWEFAHGGVRMGPVGGDEVSCDMFSPDDYEEFVWPYECKVAHIYDRLYCHSCGNLTPIFEKIVEIPNIHRIHVSPWSDMATAVDVAAGKVILEKHLDPMVSLETLSRDEMRSFVRQVTDLGTDYPLEMVVPVQSRGGSLYREIFLEETGQA